MIDDYAAPSVRLPPRKERAAQLIAKGSKQTEAARDEQVHVTKQTMGTWMKDPEFKKRIDELRTNSTTQAEEILSDHYTDAARVLVEIMLGKTTVVTKTNDDGSTETVELGLDSKLVSSRLKAALFILERTKNNLPKGVQSSKKLSSIEEDDSGEYEDIVKRARKIK